MGVFTPDFRVVDATFPIYDKGMYRVKVTARQALVTEKDVEGGEEGEVTQSSGVKYKLEMVGAYREEDDGEPILETDGFAGKPIQAYTVWTHTQGGWSFGKAFLMAVCGWSPKADEQEANEKFFREGVWEMTGDPGDPDEELNENLGENWHLPVDRLVDVYLKKEVRMFRGEERESQEFSAWTPVGDDRVGGDED